MISCVCVCVCVCVRVCVCVCVLSKKHKVVAWENVLSLKPINVSSSKVKLEVKMC